MSNAPITCEKIDELLRFLPLFDVPGRQFTLKWVGGEQTDGSITIAYPIYCDDVEEFFSIASQLCWFDYNYMRAEAFKMLDWDEFISKATLENIKTMLTYCVRGERFCDGHWESVLSSGLIVALLKRLEVLRESVG